MKTISNGWFIALYLCCTYAYSQTNLPNLDSLQLNSPQYLIDNWEDMYAKSSSSDEKAEILYFTSQACHKIGNPILMLEKISQAEEEIQDSDNILLKLNILRIKSYAMYSTGTVDPAEKLAKDILRQLKTIPPSDSSKLLEAKMNDQIGTFLMVKKDTATAMRMKLNGLRILEELPKTKEVNNELGVRYFNFSRAHYDKKNMDSTKYYLNKVLALPDQPIIIEAMRMLRWEKLLIRKIVWMTLYCILTKPYRI